MIGFASLDSAFAAGIRGTLPDGIDSVVLFKGETFFVRSEAVFTIFTLVGGMWRILTVFRLFPTTVNDSIYNWIATRRNSFFGRYNACPLPREEHAWKFLR
jgi:predicted DCC family thiol-disulfide oxidoreductase YuxK